MLSLLAKSLVSGPGIRGLPRVSPCLACEELEAQLLGSPTLTLSDLICSERSTNTPRIRVDNSGLLPLGSYY